MSSLEELIYLIIALVVAISVHEAAHAFVAYKLGDPTAKHHGRLTLNPLKHLDPLGTIMLFVARFGWGKPVPVNPHNFQNPVRDSALTALAGPMSNFAVALICSIPIKYFPQALPEPIIMLVWVTLNLNILLGVFNLLPFPPLDGSKIFAVFVPQKHHNAYFRFLKTAQPYFLAFILIDLFLLRRILGFSILWVVMGTLFDAVSVLIFLGG
jgi:Zn-dependent protease